MKMTIQNDVLRALALTIQGSLAINNVNNNHTWNEDISHTIYVNDNDAHPSYSNNIINNFQFSDNNSTSPFSMNSYDYVTSYANNQPSPHDSVHDQLEENSHISSQEKSENA